MKIFCMTVGQKYAREPHPQKLHPDSWVEIHAEDYDDARTMAFENFGRNWAFIYPKEEFDHKMFPLGCVSVIM